jgi:hypothetical protein
MTTNTESKIIQESPALTLQSETRFRIPGVVYRGEKGNYLLFEKMTASMNQKRLAELYESEKQKGNPVPTDAPLIWAIATRAHELKSENSKTPETIERLRQFLETGFRRYPNTLTRIHYSPQNDCIVHNVGTSDQYSLEGNVVGPDQGIRDVKDKGVLEALLGTQDVSKINEVSQWINGTNASLWRLNSKPKQLNKRVAGFNALDNRLNLDCVRSPRNGDPAFRVLQVE